MESAEAILENENNSNVESESFIRQQQQLSLQSAASEQDEKTEESTSEAHIESSLNEPPELESVALKSSDSEKEEESRKDGVVGEHGKERSNELAHKNSSENATVTAEETELSHCESNTEMTSKSQHYSQENVSGSEEEAVDDGELKQSLKGNESEIPLQTEQSNMNENLSDSSGQALDDENHNAIDRGEQLTASNESMDQDEDAGNSQPQSPNEGKSNDGPLCHMSAGGSETLLHFSPLGDNDLAPVLNKVSDNQQGDYDSVSTNASDASNQNSNNGDDEIPANMEPCSNDKIIDKNVEDGEESLSKSDENVGEDSIADEQMISHGENVSVSQEEENRLLDDDENENLVQDDKKAGCEMKLESKESEEDLANEEVSNLRSKEEEEETEMEVESNDTQENLSEEDNQVASNNSDNEGRSEMEVGSGDIDGSGNGGDNGVSQNSGEDTIEETSQSDIVMQGNTEATKSTEEMSESLPAAETAKEGTASNTLGSVQCEEDVEMSSSENVVSYDLTVIREQVSVDVCQIKTEKSTGDAGNAEKLLKEIHGGDHLPVVAENVDKVSSVVENSEHLSINKSSDVIENTAESSKAVENKGASSDAAEDIDMENVEKLPEAIEKKEISSEAIENVEKSTEAVENVEKLPEAVEKEENFSEATENVEKLPEAVLKEEKSSEAIENIEKSTEAGKTTSNNISKESKRQAENSTNAQDRGDSGNASHSGNSNNSDSGGVPTLEKEVSNDVEMADENGVKSNSPKSVEKETVPSAVIPASDIKKEVAESHVEKDENSLSVGSKELKKEIMNDEDDIVILDDDDEQEVSVKNETDEAKGKDASNALQISAVSGHEYKLHSDASSGNKDSDDKADKSSKTKIQKCIVCQKVTKCKFNIVRGGDTKQLCDDVCFKKFRKSPSRFLTKPVATAADSSKSPANQPNKPAVSQSNHQSNVTATTTSPSAPGLVSLLGNKPPTVTASQLLHEQKLEQQLKQQKQQQQQQKQQQLQPHQQQQQYTYKTCTVCQVMNIQAPQSFCNWKGFDYCGEICLGKFQSTLKANCSSCNSFIPNEMRASFCTKIGNIMHPFCKQLCVTDFLKRLKTCSCCKQDLSKLTVVIARVGADDKPKEFCSQSCVKKFQDQVQDVEIVYVEPGQAGSVLACSVCKSQKNDIKHTVRYHSKTFRLCSELCLSAFQYTNKIDLNKCSTCGNMCTVAESQPFFIQFEGDTKRFCSDRCISTFRIDNRKLASCSWCAARKINFDMIERQDENNKYQLFCSLNCLSLFRVNLQAKSNQAVECDRCRKIVPAQYHLTMSDASVRNFCSYACVMGFQSQFTARIAPPLPPHGGTAASTTTTGSQQVQQKKAVQAPAATLPVIAPAPPGHPHGTRNRGRRGSKGAQKASQETTLTTSTTIPVISSVVSLAPEDEVSGPQLQEKTISTLLKSLEKKGTLVTGDGKQRVVVEVPIPKMMKNKSVQCKPIYQTKATACRPHSQHKDCQTDENLGKPVIIPIPVPIYIPMPTVMYQAPAPVPVPFPIPIPVPIFVPTTRKSANGIIKTIKEIQERMPADPLEAEILMMAEAVASDKKSPGDSDSDSEMEGDTGFEPPVEECDAKIDMPEKEGEGRAEDMIQMALRMAEEMTGPMEDLETSVQPVAVNSISGHVPKQDQQAMMPNAPFEQQEEDPDYMPVKAGRGRGSKRVSRGRPPTQQSRSKRQRTGRGYPEQEMEPEEQPPPPARIEIPEPPPDTNYRLKFTYGVNAWKHWVVTKNAELESASKSNPRVRLLPMDVLKCTMDELHYSLCLFIKEVRKPNGQPYSPDSIYYLCLGIQQYLYENGRIDNIFTDLYFQRFTDALHDVLKSLQPKVNSQGQMLCRIEEEHLWESKQLGAHSPYVLLNTLIYFHTKHFILKTAADHMSLSFAQILKHWKKGVPLKGTAAAPKNASLRFYCLANNKKADSGRKSKDGGGVPVYEVTENFDNPLRCPVKLYEFFLSKCPESIKNRNDIFYPVPERSCVPDSPVWYSTQSIEHHTMDKMLTRVLLVREIQEAHLHAQPTYIKM